LLLQYASHKYIYGPFECEYYGEAKMGFQNSNLCLIKKGPRIDKENELEYPSLKDVPVEIRHKEAKKPLYLTRYE
jgi:hypothetical protein